MVGAVCVGGVCRWQNVGGVVEQNVKNEVTLVLIGADDPGVERHVVGQ